ncbi:MAG TPA: hypothetical protein DDW68_09055 [Verrucomicrobiales bacterium]|nr:hypothetical protein [Verrucomicrobiales bacterium]
MDLQIQCPVCSRRFRVHEDLTGKTVECGACEQRFVVTSETVIEDRDKFYPGEHHDALLDRLGKKPPRKVQKVSFAQAEYTPDAEAEAVLPATAGQKIAVMVGIVFFLFYTLVFVLGSGKGSVFQDVDMTKRLILAGFVAFCSSLLIIFGAKGWRARSFLFSSFLTACLIALVFVMPIHKIPSAGEWAGDGSQNELPGNGEDFSEQGEDEVSVVKRRVDYGPMQREIEKHANEEEGEDGLSMVTGIYIGDITENNVQVVQDFLQRKLSLPSNEAPAAYQRNGGKDRFIVFSGLVQRFESFVKHCEVLGKVKTHPEIRVIEVELDKSIFAEPSREVHRQMTDPNNPSYFVVNMEQLNHVNLRRVRLAVGRLASPPPEGVKIRKMPRMVEELIRLLREESDGELVDNVGHALQIWAKDDKEAVGTVGRIVVSWSKSGRFIPISLVEFLLENGSEDSALVIDGLWGKSPERWSEYYVKLGPMIEGRLTNHLETSPVELKKAALGILRKIGTRKSLPILEKYRDHQDEEIKILATRAISAIESRK